LSKQVARGAETQEAHRTALVASGVLKMIIYLGCIIALFAWLLFKFWRQVRDRRQKQEEQREKLFRDTFGS
jgi:flagellar biogenesis protein FliO